MRSFELESPILPSFEAIEGERRSQISELDVICDAQDAFKALTRQMESEGSNE